MDELRAGRLGLANTGSNIVKWRDTDNSQLLPGHELDREANRMSKGVMCQLLM
jgi:hypothetical protein